MIVLQGQIELRGQRLVKRKYLPREHEWDSFLVSGILRVSVVFAEYGGGLKEIVPRVVDSPDESSAVTSRRPCGFVAQGLG